MNQPDLDTLLRYTLHVTPRTPRGGDVTWSCGKEEPGGIQQVSHHNVFGKPSPAAAVQAWLDIYGPEPKHGIAIDRSVAHMRDGTRGLGRVLAVGRWWAIVGFVDRAPGMFPLADLTPATGSVEWVPTAEEGLQVERMRLACDSSDGRAPAADG